MWGENNASSKYLLYQGEGQDEEGNPIEINLYHKYVTDYLISGTNMFGFHPRISKNDNLQIYLQRAYQPFTLLFESEMDYIPA